MRSVPVAGSWMRTSTGPKCGARRRVKSRRASVTDNSVPDRSSGTYTSRTPYRTPRTIDPSPDRRSDDLIDTGASPNPVDPCKCRAGASPERPSSIARPPRLNDTIGESTHLDINPPITPHKAPHDAADEPQPRAQPRAHPGHTHSRYRPSGHPEQN